VPLETKTKQNKIKHTDDGSREIVSQNCVDKKPPPHHDGSLIDLAMRRFLPLKTTRSSVESPFDPNFRLSVAMESVGDGMSDTSDAADVNPSFLPNGTLHEGPLLFVAKHIIRRGVCFPTSLNRKGRNEDQ
jgi:hypothetical protein